MAPSLSPINRFRPTNVSSCPSPRGHHRLDMTRTPGKEVSRMITIPRKNGESVIINDNITITVIDIRGDKVRFGIEYPRDVTVHRKEVYDAIRGTVRLPSYGTGLSPCRLTPPHRSDDAAAGSACQGWARAIPTDRVAVHGGHVSPGRSDSAPDGGGDACRSPVRRIYRRSTGGSLAPARRDRGRLPRWAV
jgi:carbon storage regulator